MLLLNILRKVFYTLTEIYTVKRFSLISKLLKTTQAFHSFCLNKESIRFDAFETKNIYNKYFSIKIYISLTTILSKMNLQNKKICTN